MDASSIPKGAGVAETDGDSGRTVNQAGVYEHPGSGAKLTVMPDATGTGQADALVRFGFVRVDDAPNRLELKKIQDEQRKADMALEKQGIQPGIDGVDPSNAHYNGTATPQIEDVMAEKNAALERARKAEAELAELKGKSSDKTEDTGTADDSKREETPTAPPAPAKTDSAPAAKTDSKTNAAEGSK